MNKTEKGLKEAVKVIFGDVFKKPVRMLNARTEETKDIPALAEAIRLVTSYNNFVGDVVADLLLKAHENGLLMGAEFGRESSPVLYLHAPYWSNQRTNEKKGMNLAKQLDAREQAVKLQSIFANASPDENDIDEHNVVRLWWD